jgi:dipeptidyl-peptidase-4
VTSKKIIYAEIDGRGTGQKGVDMMFSVNNRLGTYEMEDQISVTKHLISTYKFIDPQRVSIWGWSYGNNDEVHRIQCKCNAFISSQCT